MINQIDIANFGSFNGLNWKKDVRDSGNTTLNFKKLNIIYGRNYSGKTTLSRIFRALEIGQLPPNYLKPSFKIFGEQGEVTHLGILNHSYQIRVYNRDFVNDNLSFLTNEVSGKIKTFAVMGEKNKEIEAAIINIEEKLGDANNKGLLSSLETKRQDRDLARNAHKTAADVLTEKMRIHANEKIKKNREYGIPIYNIENLKKDLTKCKADHLVELTLDEQDVKKRCIKQEKLPDLNLLEGIILDMSEIRKNSEKILSQIVTPIQPIKELIDDAILQNWVKQGMSYHRKGRQTCAFCRQDLSSDIWTALDSHFSKETVDLEIRIDECLISVSAEMDLMSRFMPLKSVDFYVEYKAEFDRLLSALNEHLFQYKADLNIVRAGLLKRKNSIFERVILESVSHNSDKIKNLMESINELIILNNSKSETLEKDKDAAMEALRLDDVLRFALGVNYDDENDRIAALDILEKKSKVEFSECEVEIALLKSEIGKLRSEQRDERKAVDRINKLLSHFFGHGSIKLSAEEFSSSNGIKFEITRAGAAAYNLSEGECSLIAFCYFIAKLEDVDSTGGDLIVYIDDPICSLDTNHIFFMFSLIESLIAKPLKNSNSSNAVNYKQLFISTHNLDFLKYLRKLSIPRKKTQAVADQKSKSVEDCEHFMIERNNELSNILHMPTYLKDHITEFNYLFHQIHKCTDQNRAKISHEPFYSFGNNLRKFLEAFLFFKYPYHYDKNDTLEKVRRFFEGEDTSVILISRLSNEFSHLGESPDRAFNPVDIPEISKIANYVMDAIYKADAHQFNCLLKSIGQPERKN